MNLPKSSLRAQVVAAAVFVAVAGGLIAYAHSFRAAAAAALADQSGVPPEPTPTGPRTVPLTIKTATTAREMHAALQEHFGNNARGMPMIAYVDYDAHPDRLHISFAMDDAVTTTASAKSAALRRTRDLLETVYDGDMRWNWVLVTATGPIHDKLGGASESTVIRAQFSRERLRKTDWKHITEKDVPALAEQYWVHLDLGR